MRVHCVSYYDGPDATELVDVEYQCSYGCMVDTLAGEGIVPEFPAGVVNQGAASVSWGAWPCGTETDYDVHCSGCGALLWKALPYCG
jgi:hypothetical protein